MKNLLSCFFLLFTSAISAQQAAIDTIRTTIIEKKWDVSLDVVSRYIWRGQAWGGKSPAIQPAFNVAASDRLKICLWATTNFLRDPQDDNGAPKGYHELDLGISYQLRDWVAFELWDYYWPTLDHTTAKQSFFNYGPDGVKKLDASLVFDFKSYQFPFNGLVSTLIAGNDYRYDALGNQPKQNFTTYAEIGYTITDAFSRVSGKTFRDIDLDPVIGVVFNNQAGYYTYADYNKVSLVNLGITATREFQLGHDVTMPCRIEYTHNAAAANTELVGRNFLVFAISVAY